MRTKRAVTSFATIVIELTVDASPVLRAEDYPVLARIWDNDEDAIYDTLKRQRYT